MALEVQPWTGLGAFGEQVGMWLWCRRYSVINACCSKHLCISIKNDTPLGVPRLQTAV